MNTLPLIIAGAAACALASCAGSNDHQAAARPLRLLAGSYAPADSAGIRLLSFDPATATLAETGRLTGVAEPSFQTVAPDGTVYSVSETGDSTAAACAIAVDGDRLSLLGAMPTGGGAPCYISVSPDGHSVITANYTGGSLSVFGIDPACRLTEPEVIDFDGSGPVAGRQDQPHIHCISFTPDTAYMLATDLGTDRIHMFPLDSSGRPDTQNMRDVELMPGSGPRHLVWNADGDRAYLINEISGQVTVLTYGGGELTPVQYVAADSLGAQGSGDIRLSHDGRHLYASNRLRGDGIAVFAVDQEDGTLTRTGYQLTGSHPRCFTISPDDRFVLVACRDSDAVEIYSRDPQTGLLTPAGEPLKMPKPVCLTWL